MIDVNKMFIMSNIKIRNYSGTEKGSIIIKYYGMIIKFAL
jgi:hypothetical protein